MNTFLTPDGLPILDTVHCCDALVLLRALPAGSIHCIITSPPYYGLRDYGVAGQIGLEHTPQEFVAALAAVFSEARRVLRDDGVMWLNLGDSYSSGSNEPSPKHSSDNVGKIARRNLAGLGSKNLLGIPWRVAFALQDAGWILRSEIIWAKPNPMPESVTDRPTKAHETVFLLAKQGSYWYDGEAIREPHQDKAVVDGIYTRSAVNRQDWQPRQKDGIARESFRMVDREYNPAGRNKRTVWTVATEPTPFAHFATFPQKLIEPMILAGCPAKTCAKCGAGYERVVELGEVVATGGSETGARASNLDVVSVNGQSVEHAFNTGKFVQHAHHTIGFRPTCTCNVTDTRPGVVLDMFGGSGTVGLVARRLGRSFILGDLSAEYCALARQRLAHNSDREVEKAEKGEWFTVPMFEE